MTWRLWRRWIPLVCVLAGAACTPRATSTPIPPSSLAPSPGASASPLPPVAASPTPAPTIASATLPLTSTSTPAPATASPASTPAQSRGRLVVLATGLPNPDDLALEPDGSILVSDVSDGTVRRLTKDGRLQVLVRGLSEPEGMLILPDGALVIAEQGRDRLVRYDPRTNTLAPLVNLTNRSRGLGVDGIALDARSPDALTLIIPDSPNGTLLRASLDGRTVTEIAHGLARPTAAWVEDDGSILVTDENAGALDRVRPDGTVEKLARLSVPDDVIEDGAGNIYVNTMGDGAIHRIAAATHRDTVLISGLGSPQGMIFDTDGNLIVTDPGHHRLVKVILHD